MSDDFRTKHPRYKYLKDADERNAFDIENFLSARLILKDEEEYEVYEINAAEEV